MLVLVLFIYLAREALLILLLAIVISSALDRLVLLLERFKIPRLLGTLMIFIAGISIVTALLYTIFPIAILEFTTLLEKIGTITDGRIETSSLAQIINTITPNLNNLAKLLLSGTASFTEVIGTVFGGVFSVISVLILSFYLTLSRDGVGRFLRAIFPPMIEEYTLDIYYRVRRKIGRWLEAQLFLGFIIGLLTFFGLWLLGVPYALVLAFLAAFFELVPVVGPIFAGAIGVVIAGTESLTLALYTFLLFLIIQQVENHVFFPFVMRKAVDLHPVIVLVSLLAGAKIAGFVGIVLAVPLAVAAQEVLEDWMKRKDKLREQGRLA